MSLPAPRPIPAPAGASVCGPESSRPGRAGLSPRLPLPAALARALEHVEESDASLAATVAWSRRTLPRLAGGAFDPGHLQAGELTGDGFPVEMTFTGDGRGGGGLAWTTEVAGPEVSPAQRLVRARHLLEAEGVACDPDLWNELARWQAGKDPGGADALGYGAWIGGRPAAPSAERLKLYGEIPSHAAAAATAWLAERLGTDALLPGGPAPQPRMLGLQGRQRELYLRCASALPPWRLPWLLGRAGFGHRWPDLRRALGFLLDISLPADPAELVDRPLPGGPPALSFAFDGDYRPVAFTLYLFARAVAPGDALLRRRLLAAARPLGWNPDAYRRVSAPLDRPRLDRPRLDRPRRLPAHPRGLHHGLLALTVGAEGPVRFAVGLRPPPSTPGTP